MTNNDDASSISAFDASSDIEVETKKTTTIIKRDNEKVNVIKPLSPKKHIDKNIDMGIDIIANSRKLTQIANSTEEHIPGTSQERMEETGRISPRIDGIDNYFKNNENIEVMSIGSNGSQRSQRSHRSHRSHRSQRKGDDDDDDSGSDGSDYSRADTSIDGESVRMTQDEIVKEKQSLLIKLARLERRGYCPSKKYTMHDTFKEIKNVVQTLEYEKNRDDAVKMQRKGLMTVVSILEYLNTSYKVTTSPPAASIAAFAEAVNL